MNKFYYQFDEDSELGRQMQRFHRECVKADQAAENYAKKMGAQAYYSSSYAFAGGVACVEFAKGKKVDLKMWRLADERDGHRYYEPACSTIEGCFFYTPNFTPSDTSTRIYEKTLSLWQEVAHLHTIHDWAVIRGLELTGDKEKDAEMVNNHMKDLKFIKYIQFVGQQIPKKGHKQARGLLRAVKAERMRMKLPVVPVEKLYTMLSAAKPTGDDDNQEPSTPTFFVFRNKFFLAIDRECQHPDLQLIPKQMYVYQSNLLKIEIKRMSAQNPS